MNKARDHWIAATKNWIAKVKSTLSDMQKTDESLEQKIMYEVDVQKKEQNKERNRLEARIAEKLNDATEQLENEHKAMSKLGNDVSHLREDYNKVESGLELLGSDFAADSKTIEQNIAALSSDLGGNVSKLREDVEDRFRTNNTAIEEIARKTNECNSHNTLRSEVNDRFDVLQREFCERHDAMRARTAKDAQDCANLQKSLDEMQEWMATSQETQKRIGTDADKLKHDNFEGRFETLEAHDQDTKTHLQVIDRAIESLRPLERDVGDLQRAQVTTTASLASFATKEQLAAIEARIAKVTEEMTKELEKFMTKEQSHAMGTTIVSGIMDKFKELGEVATTEQLAATRTSILNKTEQKIRDFVNVVTEERLTAKEISIIEVVDRKLGELGAECRRRDDNLSQQSYDRMEGVKPLIHDTNRKVNELENWTNHSQSTILVSPSVNTMLITYMYLLLPDGVFLPNEGSTVNEHSVESASIDRCSNSRSPNTRDTSVLPRAANNIQHGGTSCAQPYPDTDHSAWRQTRQRTYERGPQSSKLTPYTPDNASHAKPFSPANATSNYTASSQRNRPPINVRPCHQQSPHMAMQYQPGRSPQKPTQGVQHQDRRASAPMPAGNDQNA